MRVQRSGSCRLSPGNIVAGRYCVHEALAIGGMGEIYRAEQFPLGRIVALKVLRSEFAEKHPEFQKNFLTEAANCAAITHSNIVTVFDYGKVHQADATCFIAMELVEGEELRSVMHREGPFPWERAVRIAYEITRALRAAHRAGVVHRDLKPANIMLVQDDDGESVKVLDFGLAQALHHQPARSLVAGQCVGTPAYMAPEQIQLGPVDGRTDIYALGILLYRMLAGRLPFNGTPPEVLRGQVRSPVPALPDEVRQALPPGLEQVLLRCLKKSPAERWPDANRLLGALRQVHTLAGRGPQLAVSLVPPPRMRHDETGPLPVIEIIQPPPVPAGEPPPALPQPQAPSNPPGRSPSMRRAPWGLLLVVGLIVSAALAWWTGMLERPPQAGPAPDRGPDWSASQKP